MKTETAQDEVTIHFLGSMSFALTDSSHSPGHVTEYGEEMSVTSELRKANTDRDGNCWLELLDDEAAQVERWGCVMFRRGPWPEGHLRVEVGSARWHEEREAAMQAVWHIEDVAQRKEALERVRERYGLAPTSRTLAHYAEAR